MNEERDNQNNSCPMCNNPIMKHFFVGLMVFLGAFSAFYVVSDLRFHSLMNPQYQMKKMEKQMFKERKKMEKSMQKDFESINNIQGNGNQVIHMVQTKDNYKIIINLEAFNNDENNVEVQINGNVLTILGASVKQGKHSTNISKFSQSYMFGKDVELNNMTKMRMGNEYIITLPIED